MAVPGLPDGWRRAEIKRSNNLFVKTDVIYISPDGQRIKSKAELAKYLGNATDLSTFDYRAGKSNPLLLRKSKRYSSIDQRTFKNDPSMGNLVRQTASKQTLFKHPVTVIKTSPNSTVLSGQQIKEYRRKHNMGAIELLSDNDEPPFQMFWSRRLDGQHASNVEMEKIDDFQLPSNIKPFGSLANKEDIFRTIIAQLYTDTRPIRGQERKILNRIRREMRNDDEGYGNLLAFINPHQPLSYSINVSEYDIAQQEEVVRRCRQMLKETLENDNKHHKRSRI